jgi:D-xylose transport system ATP-binding protein
MATTVMETPARPLTETPALSIRGMSKRFGAVQALNDVDFEVHAGEVVALVGDNGAANSTLVKIIAGIHQPDTGEFYFDGEPVELDSPREASELGIATVYQDLALCDDLDVVANLFLGRQQVVGGLLSVTRQLDEIVMAACSADAVWSWSALLGALVIGSISNGMDLVALPSAVKFMFTGGVLAVAVVVDALARRQRQRAGRR